VVVNPNGSVSTHQTTRQWHRTATNGADHIATRIKRRRHHAQVKALVILAFIALIELRIPLFGEHLWSSASPNRFGEAVWISTVLDDCARQANTEFVEDRNQLNS
jgi:hypothetical protein